MKYLIFVRNFFIIKFDRAVTPRLKSRWEINWFEIPVRWRKSNLRRFRAPTTSGVIKSKSQNFYSRIYLHRTANYWRNENRNHCKNKITTLYNCFQIFFNFYEYLHKRITAGPWLPIHEIQIIEQWRASDRVKNISCWDTCNWVKR